MNNDFKDDTHDTLIKAFMEYSKWNERFERFGYKESAVKARTALRKIRKISTVRYQEIHAKKVEIHGNQNEGNEEAIDDN
jgi:carbonic anhydrase